MAFAPVNCADKIAGCFKEKEFKNFFEFSEPANEKPVWNEYPLKVWVATKEFRWAKLLKTVAYVVIDEDGEGNPVVEKWDIQNRKDYKR